MTSVVMNLASTTTMIVKNMILCLECIVFLELFGFDRFGRKISFLSLPTVQADSALKDPTKHDKKYVETDQPNA